MLHSIQSGFVSYLGTVRHISTVRLIRITAHTPYPHRSRAQPQHRPSSWGTRFDWRRSEFSQRGTGRPPDTHTQPGDAYPSHATCCPSDNWNGSRGGTCRRRADCVPNRHRGTAGARANCSPRPATSRSLHTNPANKCIACLRCRPASPCSYCSGSVAHTCGTGLCAPNQQPDQHVGAALGRSSPIRATSGNHRNGTHRKSCRGNRHRLDRRRSGRSLNRSTTTSTTADFGSSTSARIRLGNRRPQ